MTGLLHAHSSLRFIVLLLAIANIVVLARGLAVKSKPGLLERRLGTALAGTLHLQVLLGLALVLAGRFYPQLIGHIVMMVAAAVLVQVTMSVNRRKAEPGHTLPLVGVLGGLLLVVGGILAIGRPLLRMTVIGG